MANPITLTEMAIIMRPWLVASPSERQIADRLVLRGLLSKSCGSYFCTAEGVTCLDISSVEASA